MSRWALRSFIASIQTWKAGCADLRPHRHRIRQPRGALPLFAGPTRCRREITRRFLHSLPNVTQVIEASRELGTMADAAIQRRETASMAITTQSIPHKRNSRKWRRRTSSRRIPQSTNDCLPDTVLLAHFTNHTAASHCRMRHSCDKTCPCELVETSR